MSECALCGCPDAGQHAKVAELEAELAEAKREHVALMNVSGALMDSGEVVPEDTCLYGEAVRKITARAEAAEAKLAEAEQAGTWASEHADALDKNWARLDAIKHARIVELEAKLAEAEAERDDVKALARTVANERDGAWARIEALEKALRRYRDAVSYDHETDTITIVSSVEAMLAQHEADAALSAEKPG